ncbi:MAG: hypothetical protein M5U16_16365 [Hyphomicrobium sp.]|nr:hypothetical protein [Hyphomicrobium sp.]
MRRTASPIHNCEKQDHPILDKVLDRLIAEARRRSRQSTPVKHERTIRTPTARRRHAVGRGRRALRPFRAARGHDLVTLPAPPARASAPGSRTA